MVESVPAPSACRTAEASRTAQSHGPILCSVFQNQEPCLGVLTISVRVFLYVWKPPYFQHSQSIMYFNILQCEVGNHASPQIVSLRGFSQEARLGRQLTLQKQQNVVTSHIPHVAKCVLLTTTNEASSVARLVTNISVVIACEGTKPFKRRAQTKSLCKLRNT